MDTRAALIFANSSSAGNAIIINNAGGSTQFFNSSTAGNAQLINNVGGIVDISGLTSAGMTARSIKGAGTYFLGSKTLTEGSNDLSTEVRGTIADGGTFGGAGGSLIKVGTGTLTLSGTNSFTGGTTVSAGTLQAGSTTGFSQNSAFIVNSGGVLDLHGQRSVPQPCKSVTAAQADRSLVISQITEESWSLTVPTMQQSLMAKSAALANCADRWRHVTLNRAQHL